MLRHDWERLFAQTTRLARAYLDGLERRPVRAALGAAEMLARLDRPVPEEGSEPEVVVEALAAQADPGLTAMPGGRFFGWVIGGALPAALAADWLTAAYDQNAGMAEPTPAAAMFEQVALRWVRELLHLPREGGGALVTGGQMANLTCLLAARDAVLATAGWDVGRDGLRGSPAVHVLASAEAHDTVTRALRMLGLGTGGVELLSCDDDGATIPAALADALARVDGPTLVCLQAGNVNTGAIDPLNALAAVVEARRRTSAHRIWMHVDGAFGLWAAASTRRRPLIDGLARMDSCATDAHKWLNTPYDCGIALVADAEALRRSLSVRAAYLPLGDDERVRNPVDYTPEFSRRARGFPLYAALAQLGRSGVEALVDRCCDHAARFARELGAADGVRIANRVALNQVLVRFLDPSGRDDDAHTTRVIDRVQREGVCFMSGTTWRGRKLMRISVSNWSTDDADVTASIEALLRAHRKAQDRP